MFEFKSELFDELVNAYHETALWCEEIEPTEETDLHKLNHAKVECLLFYGKLAKTFGGDLANKMLAIKGEGYTVGHDFYLTRNGHGSGFWDKPELYGEEFTEQLTELAQTFGNDDSYYDFITDEN